jgi:hypothetical protein
VSGFEFDKKNGRTRNLAAYARRGLLRFVRLEPDLGSDLHIAWIVPAIHSAERGAVEGRVKSTRVTVVEGVEGLQPELQRCLLSEVEVLEQGRIPDLEARS